jgi:hypothetical protein
MVADMTAVRDSNNGLAIATALISKVPEAPLNAESVSHVSELDAVQSWLALMLKDLVPPENENAIEFTESDSFGSGAGFSFPQEEKVDINNIATTKNIKSRSMITIIFTISLIDVFSFFLNS